MLKWKTNVLSDDSVLEQRLSWVKVKWFMFWNRHQLLEALTFNNLHTRACYAAENSPGGLWQVGVSVTVHAGGHLHPSLSAHLQQMRKAGREAPQPPAGARWCPTSAYDGERKSFRYSNCVCPKHFPHLNIYVPGVKKKKKKDSLDYTVSEADDKDQDSS